MCLKKGMNTLFDLKIFNDYIPVVKSKHFNISSYNIRITNANDSLQNVDFKLLKWLQSEAMKVNGIL